MQTRILLLLAIAIGLASCGGNAAQTINTTVGSDTRQLAEVCNNGSRFTTTAAYEGTDPHPIVVFAPADDTALEGRQFGGDPLSFSESNGDDVQLVACPKRQISSDKKTDRTCTFSDGSEVAIYDTTYAVKVRAARTGKVIDTVDVRATDAPCPADGSSDITAVYALPTADQYQEALEQFVEESAKSD